MTEITVIGDDPLADGMRITVRMRRDFVVTDAARLLAAARRAAAQDAAADVTCAADAIFTILERVGILGDAADAALAAYEPEGLVAGGQRQQVTLDDPHPLNTGRCAFGEPPDVFALPVGEPPAILACTRGSDAPPAVAGRRHAGVMQSVYEAAGGSEGMLRLAEAWHSRVMADEIVSHAFHGGALPDHTERLAAYWGEALGGPADYSGAYGDETSVVRIHSGNGVHEEMDQRAIACFDQALDDAELTAEPLRQVLHDYFAWATTTTMEQYNSADEVPEGLSVPRWSWDGLQR